MTKARALFQGYDASGANGLWITDGTAAGTIELAVSGSDPGGLFANITQIADFTVRGSEILFAGDDASGHYNLWETDGTTTETNPFSAIAPYNIYAWNFWSVWIDNILYFNVTLDHSHSEKFISK